MAVIQQLAGYGAGLLRRGMDSHTHAHRNHGWSQARIQINTTPGLLPGSASFDFTCAPKQLPTGDQQLLIHGTGTITVLCIASLCKFITFRALNTKCLCNQTIILRYNNYDYYNIM